MNPYIVLLKPGVIWLLILASAAGYIYAAPQIEWNKLASLLLAAALSIGGATAFNHYWERDIDALMARTAKRPLPAGLVPPGNALMYSLAPAGFVLVLAGVAATLATSLYALRKTTDETMWKMYMTSSPVLALFLIALMLH